MSENRRRAYAWYAAIWIPIALLYAMALMQQSSIPVMYRGPMPMGRALISGVFYVVPVAILGLGAWRLSAVIAWPPRRMYLFVLIHAATSAIFSMLWMGMEIALIASQTSLLFAFEVVRGFRDFQIIDGIFVYGLLAAGSYMVRFASRLREEEARTARAEALRTQAELAALLGQLNPHFLFNTLHTLTALVRRDPTTAESALERFGDMLRYVLDVKRSSREDVTLADEMQFVRNYLSLEQLRLGDRLAVTERIDGDALECVLPSLTLQPIVENAIKYGIAPRAKGGSVSITANVDEKSLTIEVRDDGPGASSSMVDAAPGVGLRAVRQRLATRYSHGARFDVVTAPGTGFAVRLSVPAHTGVGA